VEYNTGTSKYAERARLIIQLIDEIDGAPVGSVPVGQPPASTAPVGQPPVQTYAYTVKPGDTPLSIAERELGDKFRVHELFQLNPGLEHTMRQRQVSDRHNEKLDSYQQFKELMLSRTPLAQDPVRNAKPAKPPVAHPRVEEEKPVTQQPAPAAGTPTQPPPKKATS
jgi:hypothetical protein